MFFVVRHGLMRLIAIITVKKKKPIKSISNYYKNKNFQIFESFKIFFKGIIISAVSNIKTF